MRQRRLIGNIFDESMRVVRVVVAKHLFGRYAVGLKDQRSDDADGNSVVVFVGESEAMESGGIEATQFHAKLDEDPALTARDVADWLRPRMGEPELEWFELPD